MRFFRLLLVSCVLTTGAFASQESTVEDKAEIPGGSILFAANADGSGSTCSFSVASGDHLIDKDKPNKCINDTGNYFRLENVPSATYITFFADKDNGAGTCLEPIRPPYKPKGWMITIKTYIHPITTGWIFIGSLNGMPVEDDHNSGIVQRGVILVSKERRDGDFIDELSCVRIVRSDVP